MKTRVIALFAVATAITLTSLAAAGPNAAKQRVAIDMKLWPQKTSYSRRCRPDPYSASPARSATTS